MLYTLLQGLLVSLLVCSVSGQSPACQPYDKTLTPATNQVCPYFINGDIWVPSSQYGTQFYLDQELNKTLFYVKGFMVMTPHFCYNAMISLFCNTAFPPCKEVPYPAYNTTVAMPIYPCESACHYVTEECKEYFKFVNTPFDCNMTVNGIRQYPPDSTGTCFPASLLPKSNQTWIEDVVPCPFPTKAVANRKDYESYCGIPCPDPTWTPKQWDTFAHVEFAFGLISFILMFFLCAHYIVDPKCRTSIKRLQFYSFLCQMLFAFSFVVAGPDAVDTTWCEAPTVAANLDTNNRCAVQGVFYLYFSMSAAIWWAFSASTLYYQLEKKMNNISYRRELFYFVCGFGIPAVFTIVSARLSLLQFFWMTPLCAVETKIPGTDLDYHYVLFYIPICVPIAVALCYIVATIVKLIIHMREMKETFKTVQAGSRVSLFVMNLRLFLWCGYLFLFFFVLVMYRAIVQKRWGEMRDSGVAWSTCKVLYELGIVGNQDACPEDHFPNPINFGGTVVYYWIIACMGSFSFVTFGTSTNVYKFWRFVVIFIWQRKWDTLMDLFKYEKTFSSLMNSSNRQNSQNSNQPPRSGVDSGSAHTPPPFIAPSDVELSSTSIEITGEDSFTSSQI